MDDPAKPSIAKRGRPSLVESKFDKHRKEITKLYYTENRELPYVMQLMKEQHGFSATKKQYKARLTAWNLHKNVRTCEMMHLARIKSIRDANSKSTRFKLRDVDVPGTKIDRWSRATRKKLGDNGFMSLLQNEVLTPPDITYDTEDEGDTASHSEAVDESWDDESTSVMNAFMTQGSCSPQVFKSPGLIGIVTGGISQYRDVKSPSFLSEDLAQSESLSSDSRILFFSTSTATRAPLNIARRVEDYPSVQICTSSSPLNDASSHEKDNSSTEKLAIMKEVHTQRPCLLCRTLEIPCTGGNPCGTCLALATKKLQTNTLSWSYCVRTSFKEVNIFKPIHPYTSLPNRMSDLEAIEPNLMFDVAWDLENLFETSKVWLLKPDDQSKSMVGLLSSKMFSKLAEKHLDKSFVADSRMLVYASSLAHVRDIPDADTDGHLTPNEMRATAAYSGEKIMNYLDRFLCPESLSQASREALQAYFLIVLGTILATGYSVPLQESPVFISPKYHAASNSAFGTNGSPSVTLWKVMHVHVCEMLSHYLVLIGSKLGVQFQQEIQRKLITSAVDRWGKQGIFTWSELTTTKVTGDSYTSSQLLDHSAPEQEWLDVLLDDPILPEMNSLHPDGLYSFKSRCDFTNTALPQVTFSHLFSDDSVSPSFDPSVLTSSSESPHRRERSIWITKCAYYIADTMRKSYRRWESWLV